MSELSTYQQKRKKVAKKEKSYDYNYNTLLILTLSTSCPKNGVHHSGPPLQAGFSNEMLGLWSTYSFGSMAYNEARSYGLIKNSKAMFQEYNSIRNFNTGYKLSRQAQLLTNISSNLNALDVMKAGSRRMAFVGLAIGAADVANKGFATKSMALFGADAAMTYVAFLGPVGAGAATIYFTGRFAYDLYQMSQDGK